VEREAAGFGELDQDGDHADDDWAGLWLSLVAEHAGQAWPDLPRTSFAALGAGSNTIWIDPEHDSWWFGAGIETAAQMNSSKGFGGGEVEM
jgi:hypothetical protein